MPSVELNGQHEGVRSSAVKELYLDLAVAPKNRGPQSVGPVYHTHALTMDGRRWEAARRASGYDGRSHRRTATDRKPNSSVRRLARGRARPCLSHRCAPDGLRQSVRSRVELIFVGPASSPERKIALKVIEP